MTSSIVRDAFDHHVWANNQVLDACAALTPEQLATIVPGTYGSIIQTARHLVGGDRGYLNLLTNGRVTEIDEDWMDVAALREAMADVESGWNAVLDSRPDEDVEVERVRDDGSRSYAPMSVRLAQAVHHGTDHRSQIATALTNLGVEPPDIDVWAWADTRHQLARVPARDALQAFAEDYTAAWCSMDPAKVAAHFAPNGSLQVNDGAPAVGRDAITETARGFYEALPDMQVFLRELAVDGARVEYRWTFTGTNTGPGGTGNAVKVDGYEEWTLDDEGLISRSLGHYDAAEYARQLREGV
jgi:uncharacterized protein (TIGR02246 family)